VAIDCAFSVVLAQTRGWISTSLRDRCLGTMVRLGLPVFHAQASPELFWESVEERTAHRDGYQRVPTMCDLGTCRFVNDLTYEELVRAFAVWQGLCRAPRSAHQYEAAEPASRLEEAET
jgi:3-dehydroquinate synthase